MRARRGLFRIASCIAGLVSLSETSAAQLAIVQPRGEATSVEHVELAYSGDAAIPVTWISLRLLRGPVALIAMLDADARVEVASQAWFEALETTASPRVLPPSGHGNCAEPARSVKVEWPRGPTLDAEAMELRTAADVLAALAQNGLPDAPLPLRPSVRYALWIWRTDSAVSTRTLRISGGAATLGLLPSGNQPVLVSEVSRGPTLLSSERTPLDLDVSYLSGTPPRSDYRRQLGDWLELSHAPLLETRTASVVFDWAIQADFSLAPLVLSYAERAARELPDIDSRACAAALAALGDGSPTAEQPRSCGAALDAWLALRGIPSELVTLQRYAFSSAAGLDPLSWRAGGEPRGPALYAEHVDDSACATPTQPPLVVSPPVTRPTPVATPPGAATSNDGAVVIVEHHETTELDCSGSPGRDPDDASCSADTSSTYDGDADCSSDSSSSYDDDPDCSSDSSSGAYDESDVDCSSDSSSSSSHQAETSCDGGPGGSDDDDGYDGDTCTGQATPARGAQKSQASLVGNPRGKRLKTSLWSMALAALVLPIRRRKRGPRTGG